MKTKILPLLPALTLSLLFYSCNTKAPVPAQPAKQDSTSAVHKPSAESIYQLEGTWLTQDNKKITLQDLKGKVQVIAMVFTNCRYACPRIVGDIQDIEKNLPPSIKNQVSYTLVSFDVARDTVARLKKFAKEMHLDSNWTLLHGDEQEVRALSMLLDVNYEKLDNGDFNHTSIISILDKNGVLIHRHEGLDMDVNEMVQKIAALVK